MFHPAEKGAQSKPSTVLLPYGRAAASGTVSLSEKIFQCTTLVFLLLCCQRHPSTRARAAQRPLHLPLPCPAPRLSASRRNVPPQKPGLEEIPPPGFAKDAVCQASAVQRCIYLPSLQSHRGKPCRSSPANTVPLF